MNDVPCVLFTVANKVAFMEAGAVPAMMRLMDRGPNDPITAIALDAVTILAEDNDEVDEAVARTGVLQRVVEMISNPENPKLTNAAVTAVMHMARDYMDAKRMLTTAGVIPKLKRIIDECAIEESPESVALAQMCVSSLTNIGEFLFIFVWATRMTSCFVYSHRHRVLGPSGTGRGERRDERSVGVPGCTRGVQDGAGMRRVRLRVHRG